MIELQCSAFIIRLMMFWYRNQMLCIKWDSILSEKFSVSNGIKQGGILSPKLFNIYVNTLSMSWNEKYIGCCLNGNVVNHFYYADDLVLLHGEYRFPEKKSSTFQGLFQGHFSSFQGHFQGRSTCIAVKKYRKTRQNFEFICNLPSSHQSLRTGTWKLLFFFTYLYVFFIDRRSIYDNSRYKET